ncbi:19688_t:CDS:1, partial [Dentiscutata erythropus]
TLTIPAGLSARGLELTIYGHMSCLVAPVTSIIRAISKEMLWRFAITTYSTRD